MTRASALPWALPAACLASFGLAWPLAETLRALLGHPQGLGRLLQDPRFFHSLAFTLGFSLLSVAVEVALGLVLGLALARPLPLAWLWRCCLLLPWASPTVVSSRLFAWLFHYQLGLVNGALAWAGLQRVDWMASSLGAWSALLALELWKTVPLVALMILAGRHQVPSAYYEAAAMDGASPWRRFIHITLPLLRPFLVVAAVFRLMDALRIFDSVWALTSGGPALATESVSLYAHALYFRHFDPAYGSWVASALLLVALLGAGLLAWAGRFRADLREAG